MKNEKALAIKKIVEKVCGVDVDRKNRRREFINARAICYKILRDTELLSFNEIARNFNKHHSTILLCLKDFKYMLLSNAQMKRDYELTLATWEGQASNYEEIKPWVLKKELFDLREQNKLLSLSIINVQKECDNRLKKFEEELKQLLNKCQE
jgi:hypothetical protein|tara:strand:+ start:448 stop:903 length:456 start_codon:yes stop_codon:yes gene_type:complete